MSGPVALLGGGEHRDGCEPIDRWLLERSGRTDPRVAVLPAASTAAMLPATAALARTWWTALGARVTVVHPGALRSVAAADAIAAADVIVLTGGVPGRLVAALGASTAWERVLDRWREGAALSGSSAGAMALLTWRLCLRAPRPLRLTPGLGPLDAHVVVPHFDRLIAQRGLSPWATRAQRRLGGLAVLGIDERTALVADGHDVRALGAGTVTVIDGGRCRLVGAGGAVRLRRALRPGWVARVSPRRDAGSRPSRSPRTPVRPPSATPAASTSARRPAVAAHG